MALVQLNVMLRPNARILPETIRVYAMRGTTGPDSLVYAVNATTLSVPITRSAYRHELKSANVNKVLNSKIPIV